jgi:hypothetical protein
MAKKTTPKAADAGSIIIQKLVLRITQRGRKDLADWRSAHQQAESIISTGSRVQLYDLYDDALLDAHLSAVVDKRIMSITNHKLQFVRDGKDVEEVAKLIRNKGFRDILREVMLAKFWGVTVAELQRNANGDVLTNSIPRKHIRPRTQQIVSEQHGADGSGIPYREGMYYNTCIEVGGGNDLGLLLKAVPYVLYKRGCWGDWAQYSEVFGMPTKIGRYNGYDDATRVALEDALDKAGSALSIVIPEEAKLEFLESKTTTASGNLYKDLAAACDDQLSILVLGNTETTKSSQSSGYAQSETHSHQQQQIADDDRAYVLGYLDTEVRRVLASLGYPMDGGEWQWQAEQENISLKDRVVIDTTLKSAGLPIDDDYFYKAYSIPKPANYDALKAAKQQDPTPPNDGGDDDEDVADDTAGKKAADKKQLHLTDTVTLTMQDLTDFFGLASPIK